MIAATGPSGGGRLLIAKADGLLHDVPRAALADALGPGDLVVANDAATLPASLRGTHGPTGAPVEIRLAGWLEPGDPSLFVALAFGHGDHRTRTEDRPAPPSLAPGDRLSLGPLAGRVEWLLDHPRLFELRLFGHRAAILAGIARHGRPVQYAHVPAPLALWDVWTGIAAEPVAFEAPSAGFALDWRTVAAWRRRGIGFATVTHAAGLSSTGDPALDARLPLDEPYGIPEHTAAAIARTRAAGGHIVAIGTTVVRALESAARPDGTVAAGPGIARGRILPGTPLHIADAILTGVHQPGESHWELLRAFADDAALDAISGRAWSLGYRTHEFGDSLLIERRPIRSAASHLPPRAAAA